MTHFQYELEDPDKDILPVVVFLNKRGHTCIPLGPKYPGIIDVVNDTSSNDGVSQDYLEILEDLGYALKPAKLE